MSSTIRIYTDDKNLTWKGFNNDRVLRWRIILEEYDPDIKCITGEKNIDAYALSWLPNNGNQETTHESTYLKKTI